MVMCKLRRLYAMPYGDGICLPASMSREINEVTCVAGFHWDYRWQAKNSNGNDLSYRRKDICPPMGTAAILGLSELLGVSQDRPFPCVINARKKENRFAKIRGDSWANLFFPHELTRIKHK